MRSGGQGDILPLHLSNQSNESSAMKQSRTCYLYAATRKTALKCHGVFMIICSQAELMLTKHKNFMSQGATHSVEIINGKCCMYNCTTFIPSPFYSRRGCGRTKATLPTTRHILILIPIEFKTSVVGSKDIYLHLNGRFWE